MCSSDLGGRVNDGNGGERVGRGAEESGADPGEGRGRRGGREGERGEWEGGPRRRGSWRPYPLRRRCRRGGRAAARPCSDPVGGTGKGRGRRWAGPGARGCGPVWAGGFGADGPRVQWGGKACSFFSFSVLFCFLFSFYLFISFSVLFHLKYLGIL